VEFSGAVESAEEGAAPDTEGATFDLHNCAKWASGGENPGHPSQALVPDGPHFNRSAISRVPEKGDDRVFREIDILDRLVRLVQHLTAVQFDGGEFRTQVGAFCSRQCSDDPIPR
jgi:hypothetical protein